MEKIGHLPTNGSNNHSVGLAGECLVRFLLHSWRYDIYSPDNPSTSVDFAIKNGDEWATIQVKTTLSGTGVRLQRETRKKGGRGKYNYDDHDFDYLFAVKFPKVYVIPFLAIHSSPYIGLKDYEDYAYDLFDKHTYINPPKILTGELNE